MSEQKLNQIVLIEKSINQLLQAHIDVSLIKPDLTSIETVLIQIYQYLAKHSQKYAILESGGYASIQEVLQQQQQRNRILIKKQLEFREYQNSLIEQLSQQKNKVQLLNIKVSKLNDDLRDKCLQILSLKNQYKALVKDSKISTNANLTTRQTLRQTKVIKQSTLYALYSNHKNKGDAFNDKSSNNLTLNKLDKFQKQTTTNKAVKSYKRRNSEQLVRHNSGTKRKSVGKKI